MTHVPNCMASWNARPVDWCAPKAGPGDRSLGRGAIAIPHRTSKRTSVLDSAGTHTMAGCRHRRPESTVSGPLNFNRQVAKDAKCLRRPMTAKCTREFEVILLVSVAGRSTHSLRPCAKRTPSSLLALSLGVLATAE